MRLGRAKQEKSRASKASVDDNPYLNARRVWNDRLGETASAKKFWRITTILSLLIAIPSVWFALARSGQTKVIPYIVEVDSLGQIQGAGPARPIPFQQEYIVEAALADFIRNYRGVTVDRLLQEDRIDELYLYIQPNSTAIGKINTYFRDGNSPYLKAAEATTTVDVRALTRVTENSYNIEWFETDFNRSGTEEERRRYQAVVTYRINPPTTERVAQRNPLGIYVVDLDVSQIETER